MNGQLTGWLLGTYIWSTTPIYVVGPRFIPTRLPLTSGDDTVNFPTYSGACFDVYSTTPNLIHIRIGLRNELKGDMPFKTWMKGKQMCSDQAV